MRFTYLAALADGATCRRDRNDPARLCKWASDYYR